MGETEGRFVRGQWVVDPTPAPEEKTEPEVDPIPEEEPALAAPTIEERMHETAESVRRAVGDVVSTDQHLLGTPEGHEHIQQAARKAGEDLERAINAWAESARRALQKR